MTAGVNLFRLENLMKNLVIGQSGGPTAVINASLYGAVKAFLESGTDGHVLE